jgi:hypothetical protein
LLERGSVRVGSGNGIEDFSSNDRDAARRVDCEPHAGATDFGDDDLDPVPDDDPLTNPSLHDKHATNEVHAACRAKSPGQAPV